MRFLSILRQDGRKMDFSRNFKDRLWSGQLTNFFPKRVKGSFKIGTTTKFNNIPAGDNVAKSQKLDMISPNRYFWRELNVQGWAYTTLKWVLKDISRWFWEKVSSLNAHRMFNSIDHYRKWSNCWFLTLKDRWLWHNIVWIQRFGNWFFHRPIKSRHNVSIKNLLMMRYIYLFFIQRRSKVSYWKHSAQANSKSVASIQSLFTVGNLGYSLYLMPNRNCENCVK